MSIQLRSYQTEVINNVFNEWNYGKSNVLAVLPTGAGKSLTTASIIQRFAQPTCLSVHRGELVMQLSEALAMVGIYHRVIAAQATVSACVARHMRKFGKSFINPSSPVGVASTKTLLSRAEDKAFKQWASEIKLWAQDEAHHIAGGNEFMRSLGLFPNARGLGVTATPERCDRKSLARSQGGLFDTLVEGPDMRWMIDEGYLSDYRYIAPPPSIEMTEDDIGSSGEFKKSSVAKKSHDSRIVGDIVQTYMRYAMGKAGITFVVDIETAVATAKAFNDAGIPAAAVSGKTPGSVRIPLMDKFASGTIKQLVNVDLFDEGLDVPGVEVVSMGRPTMSLGKFRQQAGRMVRPVYADGFDLNEREGRLAAIAAGPKPRGILIDHVNNYKQHKLPDTHRIWQLILPDGVRKSKKADDEIPMTSCESCFEPYERVHSCCPHCGHKPEPAGRSAPEQIDGDLIEFGPELLAQLRGEVSRVDGAPQIPHGASEVVKRSIEKRWKERQEAQEALRHSIAVWAGSWRDKGATDSESYRRFYFTYKMDVLTAMSLGKTEAEELTTRIQLDMMPPCPV